MTMPARFLGRHLSQPYRYRTTATDFDGVSDYAHITPANSGIVASDEFTLMMSLRVDASPGIARILAAVNNGFGRTFFAFDNGRRIQLVLRNSLGVTLYNFISSATFPASATWRHFLLSGILSGVSPRVLQYTGNTVVAGTVPTPLMGTVAWNFENLGIMAGNTGIDKQSGCLGCLELRTGAGTFSDFAAPAVRALWVDPLTGRPVDRNVAGRGPASQIYCPDGNLLNNQGVGGNGTVFGAPVICSSSPTD